MLSRSASTASSSTARKLIRTVLPLFGGGAELIEAREREWASATFCGARHVLVLRSRLARADAPAPAALALLPEHQFSLEGEIVADCAVTRVQRTTDADGQSWLTATIELLTIAAD